MCTKSVGLMSGYIKGSHGILIKPDSTLTNLHRVITMASIKLVVLPGGEQGVSRLESDPRVHELLRRVVAQQGIIATGVGGARILRAAALCNNSSTETDRQHPLILSRTHDQSIESFAQDLVRRSMC